MKVKRDDIYMNHRTTAIRKYKGSLKILPEIWL